MDQSPRWVSVAINWAFGTSIFCWGMVREESCSVLKQIFFPDFLTLAFRDLHFGSKMAFSYHTMENLMRLWPFWRKRKFWPALKWCWFCWIFANTFISFCSLKDTFCSSCQSGSVKLSVKFSQKKLGRGLKIVFAPAFTNPCSQKIHLHGWCLLVLYWFVLFRDKVLRLYKFPKSCFSWLVVNICLSENCQIGWGNVVFEK